MDKPLIDVTIEGLPKTGNELLGANWKVRVGNSKTWLSKLDRAITTRPIKPLTKVRLRFTRASGSEPDHDGLVSGFKAVQDALVKLDIIINDKPSNIGSPEYVWERAPKLKGFIRIELWAVADESEGPKGAA